MPRASMAKSRAMGSGLTIPINLTAREMVDLAPMDFVNEAKGPVR